MSVIPLEARTCSTCTHYESGKCSLLVIKKAQRLPSDRNTSAEVNAGDTCVAFTSVLTSGELHLNQCYKRRVSPSNPFGSNPQCLRL